jgi:hypothetical protein
MVAPRLRFHQTVFAIFVVQVERAVNQYRTGNYAENDTDKIVYARHKHDHD